MHQVNSNPVIRRGMFCLAWVFVLLGIIGLVMPMMPGAFFLFVAAWLFSRSSERFHRWLVEHRQFGPVVRAWEEGYMTRELRRRILLIMWGSMLISMAIVAKLWPIVVIAICGAGVTVYLYRLPLRP